MASAAAAVGVFMHVIRYAGGWAAGSSTVDTYVHPECQPSLEAVEFFGHLCPPAADDL